MEKPSPAALACVGGIAVSWVASTQLSQTLVSDGGEASGANFFLVWYSTTFNILLLPFFWACGAPARAAVAAPGSAQLTLKGWKGWGGEALPFRKLVRAACLLLPLWLGANYLYVRALGLTSAATVTAVFSTTPAVVAVLSHFVLKERMWPVKLGAVALAILGTLLVDLAPTFHASEAAATEAASTSAANTLLAGALTAVAALCAGSYKVILRSLLGETTAPAIALYLSILGAICFVIGIPIVLLLQALGWETVDFATLPWGFL